MQRSMSLVNMNIVCKPSQGKATKLQISSIWRENIQERRNRQHTARSIARSLGRSFERGQLGKQTARGHACLAASCEEYVCLSDKESLLNLHSTDTVNHLLTLNLVAVKKMKSHCALCVSDRRENLTIRQQSVNVVIGQ